MWSSKPFLRAKHLATTVQFSLYLNLLNLKLPPFSDTYGYRMLLTLIFYAKDVNSFDWNFIYDDDINK